MKNFSAEDISRSDGKDGKPALVVVDGKVFDVSASKRWPGGLHMRRHQAGSDLSSDLKAAPHGPEVLERVQLVGEFTADQKTRPEGLKGSIEAFLERHPFYRRHPHPAVVHFPLGLILVTPLLELAGVIQGSSATEWAAFLTLAIGSVSIMGAIVTGYLTWWLNYDAAESPVIKNKRIMAWSALLLSMSACFIRIFLISDPLKTMDLYVMAYMVNIVAVAAAVGFTGFLGGKLTFPYD